MDLGEKFYEPKKRTRKWIIIGLIVVAIFVVYNQITSVSMPTLHPLVDTIGREYYKYIVPVSEEDKTYLMAVAYEYGFSDPYEVFKIYYVSFGGLSNSPLKAVVYNQLENINEVRFYRENTDPKSPITVVLSLREGNAPDRTWTFTPPETFPSELLEKEGEKSGFRTYHGWDPGF